MMLMMTPLDTNRTPKKKQAFYISAYFIILNLKDSNFLFPDSSTVDTIRTTKLRVYNLLDPMETVL